eukprot:GHVQ01010587.1.p1 GENE.GHVQ01010587.1~~GHVQ01010587.1.p1  ORF type:complete len:261 (+),score=58.85 GHVQ01010587.1:83-865(+)
MLMYFYRVFVLFCPFLSVLCSLAPFLLLPPPSSLPLSLLSRPPLAVLVSAPHSRPFGCCEASHDRGGIGQATDRDVNGSVWWLGGLSVGFKEKQAVDSVIKDTQTIQKKRKQRKQPQKKRLQQQRLEQRQRLQQQHQQFQQQRHQQQFQQQPQPNTSQDHKSKGHHPSPHPHSHTRHPQTYIHTYPVSLRRLKQRMNVKQLDLLHVSSLLLSPDWVDVSSRTHSHTHLYNLPFLSTTQTSSQSPPAFHRVSAVEGRRNAR